MDTFSGKVALVTGGASGIGRGLVEALARRGATVAVADVNASGAEEVARALVDAGAKAEPVPLDVTNADEFARAVSGLFDRHGRLDFFFNNAGIGGPFAETHEITLEEWQRVLAVNLHGVIHGIAATYPRMVKQGFGHIVNTASIAGLIPTAMFAPYTAAKHAVVGISNGLRVEARARGIRVSVVCPGFVDTAIFRASVTYKRVGYEDAKRLMPSMISPAECADAVLAGVQANRAIIPVAKFARLAWWVWRWSPGLVFWIAERRLAQVRPLRS